MMDEEWADVTMGLARCIFIDAWQKENRKLTMRWRKEITEQSVKGHVSPLREKNQISNNKGSLIYDHQVIWSHVELQK